MSNIVIQESFFDRSNPEPGKKISINPKNTIDGSTSFLCNPDIQSILKSNLIEFKPYKKTEVSRYFKFRLDYNQDKEPSYIVLLEESHDHKN